MGFAEKDIWVPQKVLNKIISSWICFSEDLKEIKSSVEIYKGTNHGFAFPERKYLQ